MYCNLLDEMTRSVQLQKSETPAASMRVKTEEVDAKRHEATWDGSRVEARRWGG